MSLFRLDAHGVFHADALSAVPNLEHGFGTRNAEGWPALPAATVRQVHSGRAVFAAGPGVHGEADALITSLAGFVLSVRTADCVPILIADPANHAVAAVHAGWRGTVSGILSKALEAMANRFGTAPQEALVAIGPAIGPCCYEVGPEVAVQFGHPAENTHVDLIEANRQQALSSGVSVRHITVLGRCTLCEATLFHSYRRDREQSGRLVAAIGWSK